MESRERIKDSLRQPVRGRYQSSLVIWYPHEQHLDNECKDMHMGHGRKQKKTKGEGG